MLIGAPSHAGNVASLSAAATHSPDGVPAKSPVALAFDTLPEGSIVTLTFTVPATPYLP